VDTSAVVVDVAGDDSNTAAVGAAVGDVHCDIYAVRLIQPPTERLHH
jgi:hypothetical protein